VFCEASDVVLEVFCEAVVVTSVGDGTTVVALEVEEEELV
jgi:hypothetical protein